MNTKKTEEYCRAKIDFNSRHDEYRPAFRHMMSKYLSMRDGHLQRISFGMHLIELMNSVTRIVPSASYQTVSIQRFTERDDIGKMIKGGVAEPATTEWTSPVVLAPTKSRGLRFWVDYSQLNAITIPDSYPIQSMEKCND